MRVRFRLCLPHISHACQSKFDLRALCRAGITKNTDGNPGDSPIVVNNSSETKSEYLRRKRNARAPSRWIPFTAKNRNNSAIDHNIALRGKGKFMRFVCDDRIRMKLTERDLSFGATFVQRGIIRYPM